MTTQAVSAASFTGSIGINTHLDFSVTAYANVSVVESALTYLGVKQVRDAMQFATSPELFAQVAAATGMHTLAKPWPILAIAKARPRMRTNQREIETLTTMEPINESPGLMSSQRTSMNWMKPCA